MSSALESAISHSRALSTQTYELIRLKASSPGFDPSTLVPSFDMSSFGNWRDQSKHRRKYAQFRGYVHAAVNALAQEGAERPFLLGKAEKKKGKKDLGNVKGLKHILEKMPNQLRMKAASEEFNIITSNPMIDLMDKPNPIQYRYQFVYSFIANLCLTGFGYLVAAESEDGDPEIYSLPTTWVRPIHDKGAFSEFLIVNPDDPASSKDAKPLTRDQVAFACLPDPSNPMSAMAPSSAQNAAISIDEKIQTCQVSFFDNGIFPSVVVTVGKNPHPNVPGGIRPRLTAAQRRQVYAAIKKVSGGVANYGNPAIVDGLIEKIERLSATQNEMGWEKSERTVRSRILSAYGVHPFILGEEMAGSYAQAYTVESRFAKKVNTFLDLLSTICTDFVPALFGHSKGEYYLWWEKMAAEDPQMELSLWRAARDRGDVNRNEFRGFMGLAPDVDTNEAFIDKAMYHPIVQLAEKVSLGGIDPDQAVAILEGMGLPVSLAKRIAGDGISAAGVVTLLEDAIGKLERDDRPRKPDNPVAEEEFEQEDPEESLRK